MLGNLRAKGGSNWPRTSELAFWKWCSRPRTSKEDPASEWSTGKVQDFIPVVLPFLRVSGR